MGTLAGVSAELAWPAIHGSRTTIGLRGKMLQGRCVPVRSGAVKVQIRSERCQGHGRCYDLVPGLFGEDEEGYAKILGDGAVPSGEESEARLAAANCPERAIDLLQEA
jgi:ferredoxin